MGVTIEKCLQAWTNSLKQMNAKADIVFFGDSLIYYGNFASIFPDKVVCNLGLRGDTIQGLINRVEQVRILKPQKVFLMAGINDVATCTVSEFHSLYADLLKCLRSEVKEAEMILQSILPVNNKEFIISCNNNQIISFNKTIAKLAESYQFQYLDIYPLYVEDGVLPKRITIDGLHIKKDGYQRWYDLVSRCDQ